MDLRHIVVAADESDAGRQAVRTGLELAARASARVTIVRVVSVSAVPVLAGMADTVGSLDLDGGGAALERLQCWLQADVIPAGNHTPVELGIAFGFPGIEICRFGESRSADLLVLGRKQRSQTVRLLLGDTADAVVRRSSIPCLFVPPGRTIQQVLVAVDGSERGMSVLTVAYGFARSIGARMRVLTVEHLATDEPPELAAAITAARSSRIQDQVDRLLGRDLQGSNATETKVEFRRGRIVQQILDEVDTSTPDVLTFGYHRGGPPGIIQAGSTARHLVHSAPCAVLTVPL